MCATLCKTFCSSVTCPEFVICQECGAPRTRHFLTNHLSRVRHQLHRVIKRPWSPWAHLFRISCTVAEESPARSPHGPSGSVSYVYVVRRARYSSSFKQKQSSPLDSAVCADAKEPFTRAPASRSTTLVSRLAIAAPASSFFHLRLFPTPSNHCFRKYLAVNACVHLQRGTSPRFQARVQVPCGTMSWVPLGASRRPLGGLFGAAGGLLWAMHSTRLSCRR